MLLDIPNAAHPLNIDTGQAACYDEMTILAACPVTGSPFYGQDAQYGTVTKAVEFTKGEGFVIDQQASLVWEDPAAGGDIHCTNSEALGHNDWWRPTRNDWLSLLDLSAPGLPAVFEDRTTILESEDSTIDLMTGLGVTLAEAPQRCVRHTKTWPRQTQLAFTGQNTITHFSTRLAWTARNKMEAVTWREALSYCENLVHESFTDWRLPNLFELASVTPHLQTFDLAFERNIDNLSGRRFWTSSTQPGDPTAAYQLLHGSGEVESRIKTKSGYVLCARTDQ